MCPNFMQDETRGVLEYRQNDMSQTRDPKTNGVHNKLGNAVTLGNAWIPRPTIHQDDMLKQGKLQLNFTNVLARIGTSVIRTAKAGPRLIGAQWTNPSHHLHRNTRNTTFSTAFVFGSSIPKGKAGSPRYVWKQKRPSPPLPSSEGRLALTWCIEPARCAAGRAATPRRANTGQPQPRAAQEVQDSC